MAIPHAVFAELTQSVVTITTLENAVAFDACDKKPVDIICTVLGADQVGVEVLGEVGHERGGRQQLRLQLRVRVRVTVTVTVRVRGSSSACNRATWE